MIGVCLKWVDPRPEIDRHGSVLTDDRFSGLSSADEAALEWALRCRDAWGSAVTVITVGPLGADGALRHALAAGATDAIRVEAPTHAPSQWVAHELARHLRPAALIWCGDYSLDRGTGSVPAFLAAECDAAQALGLVHIDLGQPGQLTALRRLDGGRRERISTNATTVLSVEGSTARLRRAPLRALLAGGSSATITTAHAEQRVESSHTESAQTRPFRPRSRILPAPVGDNALQRVRSLTDSASPVTSADAIVLDPPAAAQRIIQTLREWGYAE